MSPPAAVDDIDAIAARLRELAAERDTAFRCSCETVVGEHGEPLKVPSIACPVHGGSTLAALAAAIGVRP